MQFASVALAASVGDLVAGRCVHVEGVAVLRLDQWAVEVDVHEVVRGRRRRVYSTVPSVPVVASIARLPRENARAGGVAGDGEDRVGLLALPYHPRVVTAPAVDALVGLARPHDPAPTSADDAVALLTAALDTDARHALAHDARAALARAVDAEARLALPDRAGRAGADAVHSIQRLALSDNAGVGVALAEDSVPAGAAAVYTRRAAVGLAPAAGVLLTDREDGGFALARNPECRAGATSAPRYPSGCIPVG